MKYALINNELKHIHEIERGVKGVCPVCHTEMIAKKGEFKQYFAHVINTDLNCDAKFKQQQLKLQEVPIKQKEITEYNELYNNIYNNEIPDIVGFTEEQLAIINSPESRVLVNAKAGSGKTSTIEEFVKRNPNKKILYLVFNKSMSNEAKERFGELDHVEVRTIHSFAYKKFGSMYRNKLANNINVFDAAKALKKFIKEADEFLYMENLIDKFDDYLLSASKSIKEFCTKNNLSKSMEYDLNKLFNQSKNGNMKVTHNFYYKLWHLSNPQFNGYDMLMIDELQDVNEALCDILDSNTTLDKIIGVGDEHQAIYKFAKCVNAFDILDNKKWKGYKLTYSFRIGNTLAKALEKCYGGKIYNDFSIIGMNPNQRIVRNIDEEKPHYVLCRFNATIISLAMVSAVIGMKIYIEGGKAGISFDMIKNMYELKYHNKKHYTLKKYENYNHMISMATQTRDYEILLADKLINIHKESTLAMVRSIQENMVDTWTEADVCYSTLHKSKGQTIIIPMKVSEDCISLIEDFDEDRHDFISEANLLYVGCTRCKNEIELPTALFELYENGAKLI